MASIELDEAEDKRENLYTVFEEKSALLGRKGILQRIAIISQIANKAQDGTAIGEQYEQFLKNISEVLQVEPATGFLMIHRRHAVHIVEAPMALITLYLREVYDDSVRENRNFDISKVLMINHDIAIPHYPYFYWQLLEIEGVDSDNFQPGDKDEKIVIDLIKQILDIGIYILKTPRHFFPAVFDNLFTNNSELLPSQGVINYLLKGEVDCISTVQDMLQQYDTPYDTTASSDYVWPIPTTSHPYTTIF